MIEYYTYKQSRLQIRGNLGEGKLYEVHWVFS
jgi:hypothetical protein